MKRLTGLVFIIGLLAGCAKPQQTAAVTGTVTYLVRIALPPDAKIIARIEDISLADAPSKIIGETEFLSEGKQVPFDFEVQYDPSVIIEGNRYTLSARIEDKTGKLLFISDTITPVITRGNPVSGIEVLVIPVNQ